MMAGNNNVEYDKRVDEGNNIPGCYQLNAVDAHDQPQTFENKYTRLLGLIL